MEYEFRGQGGKTMVWNLTSTEQFLDSEETPPGWVCRFISIHDHWLSEKEADEHWMSYPAINGSDTLALAEYDEKENLFINFFQSIDKHYGLHLWNGPHANDVSKFEDESHLIEICKKNCKESHFHLFRCDSLELVIIGNFDLTFAVFRPKKGTWKVLKEMTRNNGLYLI
ncbi:MAG: hypothetical protein V6Z89_06960 [Desulfobacter sp.]